MAFDPVTAIANVANTVIDRLIPDRTQAAQAKANLLEMQVKGELDTIAAQIEVNKAEAANNSVFVAGWRPWIGWVCGMAFAYCYVIQPFLILLLSAFHTRIDPAALPKLDLTDMMPVLLGMLGLGAMRSYDKVQGTGNGA